MYQLGIVKRNIQRADRSAVDELLTRRRELHPTRRERHFDRLTKRVGTPLGVSVHGPDDGRWVLRSEDRATLLDHLAAVERPPGRLRLHVDPVRIR